MNDDNKKPPLGIMPKDLWIEQRKENIQYAVLERIKKGFKIPLEWIAEWNSYQKS